LSEKNIEKQHPKHIAIILDGNGRWAKKRFMPRFVGHQKGLKAVKRVVSYCANNGIEALTLFAFSTENCKRPKEEVSQLMGLFLKALKKEVNNLHENNVRLRVVGNKSSFSEEIQSYVRDAEKLTSKNSGLTLNIAANYGGRWDILQAVKAWQKVNSNVSIDELDEVELSKYMTTADLPEPDLLIRTGGEKRISNFLIWQMAYAEFYFTDTLWPDFNEDSLEKAIHSFNERERRFGKTSEQVSKC